MTGYRQVYTERGRLFYLPDIPSTAALTPSSGVFQGRSRRPHRIHISRVAGEDILKPSRLRTSTAIFIGKLAGSRENAKRFLRSIIASSQNPAFDKPQSQITRSDTVGSRRSAASSRVEESSDLPTIPPEMLTVPGSRSSVAIGGPISGMASRPHLADSIRTASTHSSSTTTSASSTVRVPSERPLATGNGINVSVALAEPVLFLQGFEQNDSSNRSTAMLRGSLHLNITKCTKIKAVTLKFKGRAVTKWPEGIPPKKQETEEVNSIMSHTWPFFNAQFQTAESGPGADHVELHRSSPPSMSDVSLPKNRASFDISAIRYPSPNASTTNLSRSEAKRLSLQVNQSRSFGKNDNNGQTVAQKGYLSFAPGDYVYNFELPLDSHLPETIDVELGSVKYELEATVERAGTFKSNLVGTKEVTLIRAPSEGSLEQVEPIAISRNWEDQLHYDIVISGKSFPLGAQVPIAFKLTPLAKVQCHRIKVFVTENIEYYCNNKRVHRMDGTRKVQLFEKRADGAATSTFPGSTMRITSGGGIPYDLRAAAARGEEIAPPDTTNLLGNLESNVNVGPTEMEFNVQLPNCNDMRDKEKNQKLHFDTTYQNIQVHHWIKIVLRLSKPDPENPGRRRHFEISIDSPFHILSCQATQANTALPAYTSPENASENTRLYECGCPGAPVRRTSPTSYVPTLNALNSAREQPSESPPRLNRITTAGLARPQAAHIGGPVTQNVSRPIHLLRSPSFNPPAFSEEEPPPPLETPPPQYDSIASPTTGLSDYFSRLSDAYDEDSDSDNAARTPGRIQVPLTPGGRVNRSMDERRTWEPIGQAI
ncbi:hypothetical protein K402DRAFT_410073 [Aulographum hederae CBS 113979]|uniref:Arrestin C-terminal-like domain-containing protein n=1 Tax=Aulographum hederae CBS 113979 TaxID=1176131 RepID=A0A6G1HE06_9PEZI|nr:hypothetical protein K402DRAFT_410073 [Aulographum hederae CBS 113979]